MLQGGKAAIVGRLRLSEYIAFFKVRAEPRLTRVETERKVYCSVCVVMTCLEVPGSRLARRS